MDDALNNTSVILVFEVEGAGGFRRLLFPGDAQIENWEYALKIADAEVNKTLLRATDLYKVGHHGSRNATPRTLFDLWTDPGVADRSMTGLMSTKPGVYGRSPETAVPRSTLVQALSARMTAGLIDTEKLDGLWVEVSADTFRPIPSSKPLADRSLGEARPLAYSLERNNRVSASPICVVGGTTVPDHPVDCVCSASEPTK